MPLKKSCSITAFEDNIRLMIREGKPKDQAVAIAFSTLRDVCGVSDDAPRMTAKEIVGKAESALPPSRALVYLAEANRQLRGATHSEGD